MNQGTPQKGKFKKLKIDDAMFQLAFQSVYDYQLGPVKAYLDMESGFIVWLFEDDEDAVREWNMDPAENAANRQMVQEFPDRYIEIPGQMYKENSDFLEEFLESDWTDDNELQQLASSAYSGSVGRWVNAVNDEDVVHKFENFRRNKITKIAEKYLRKLKIKVIWD